MEISKASLEEIRSLNTSELMDSTIYGMSLEDIAKETNGLSEIYPSFPPQSSHDSLAELFAEDAEFAKNFSFTSAILCLGYEHTSSSFMFKAFPIVSSILYSYRFTPKISALYSCLQEKTPYFAEEYLYKFRK